MTPEDITHILAELFDSSNIQVFQPGSWQVDHPKFRLLILLSEDQSWLRALVPIAGIQEAQPFLEQLLAANFDLTQETRYALNQGALWGVFQHALVSLSPNDFSAAVAQLVVLNQQGLSDYFNQVVDQRIRQIIQVAKRQGQSLEATLQNVDRFYQEGMIGEMDQGAQSREETLAAWRRRLELLWPEVTESSLE